jgi:curved DNA-binding protein CbpA
MRSEIGLAEARSILGVGPQASRAEIQAAHARLIRLAHPDKGGTTGLAAQLNAARDRLLSGK